MISIRTFIKYYASQDNYDCNKCQHSQSDDYTVRFSGLCSEGCCRTKVKMITFKKYF